MRHIRTHVIVIILSLSVCAARAQVNRISGDFYSLKFPQFVERVESTTVYHFYYKESDLDSFDVNIKLENDSLPDVLKKIFSNTDYRFSIDASNHVFIVKGKPLQTTLAEDFFKPENGNQPAENETGQPEEIKQEKERSAFSENRLFIIGSKLRPKKGNATLSGFVTDIRNGEALSGASLYLDTAFTGVVTDRYGYYTLSVKPGLHILEVNSIGMREGIRHIMVYNDGKLNIEMSIEIPRLRNVIITAEKGSNIRSTQMGIDRLSVAAIRDVPVVFGEADILRVVLTLPGVTSVGEASTGFNVRGGAADQNLILFDGATVYNPSHMLGFFSAFNPDVVKGVELYKSVIPVKYGGRLSSVLDVDIKEGNDKKISGNGGIGPLTSNFTIEGPLKKDQSSFIFGARTTYSNWILKAIPDQAYSNSRAAFYDASLHISENLNSKNSLYFTGYVSNDNFRFDADTTYRYGNRNAIIKWKHNFNSRFYSLVDAGADHYQYAVTSSLNPVSAFKLTYDINQTTFRADFNYRVNNKQSFNFGLNSIFYKLHPGSYLPFNNQSLVAPNELEPEQGLESAAYLGYDYNITPDLTLNAGIRYSMFNYIGAHDVYDYLPGQPRSTSTIIDTVSYGAGKFIKTYQAPEYRLSLRYVVSDNTSIKLGFNTLRQYIHQLSNTIAIAPTDIWKLSDEYLKPETGTQYSIGLYRNFESNNVETSLEVYYKNLGNMIDFKSGASILMNQHIETDIINSKGKAYGAELLIKKPQGKFNGWLSYTYSRSLIKSDDPQAGETINGGKYYPTSYDRPNNLNFIGNYRFSHRLSLSLNVVYSTGRPITLPIAVYDAYGSPRLLYSGRNAFRLPDYFRTDISVSLDGNAKIKQALHNSWSLGIYNVTGRANVYSAYFVSENGQVKGYQLSIFGTLIPFISYNFRF
jgi:outer membrane receptor protein involved in Fe transport